jgi:uncharacterized protein
LRGRAEAREVGEEEGGARVKLLDGILRLSASDLANHLACRHLTALDRAGAEGRLKPPQWRRPEAEVLAQRGFEHERAFLMHLERGGRRITWTDEADGPGSLERTVAAMRSGAPVIAQATLANGRWLGRADVLLRVERASELGAWSYEPLDTKLARETRAGAILQLCLYADLIATIQGVHPEHMHVVPRRTDFPLETYRVDDHLAYFRLVRRRLEAAVDGAEAASYPEVVPHCDVCRWWPRCDKQRRNDDHLSLVAGISRMQTRELQSREIETLARLAAEPLPIAWKPSRGSRDGFVRAREQARIQLEGRIEEMPVHEMLALEPGRGLELLPEPSSGDLFLDLEGDPYVDEGGLEYLFGWAAPENARPGELALEVGPPAYHARWALDAAAERRGFEAVMDAILERWRVDPNMHVYHFGAYEPGAIKRLMGRHATRESDVDRLLRAGRFVDLHAVVRQSVRASVEEYSIKKLEPHYDFVRELPLDRVGPAKRAVEAGLELGTGAPDEADAGIVEAYNRDDCLSARALRDWLEELRARAIAAGASIARPPEDAGAPSAEIGERERRARELAARLLDGVPELREERDAPQQARWLLAHLLDWHRREDKAPWWEYFRMRDLSEEELLDENSAIAGMEFVERVSARRSVVDRYRYPAQETSIREGKKVRVADPDGQTFGVVVAIDLVARTVDIQKSQRTMDDHPRGVFAHEVYKTGEHFESLMRLGQWVADHGIDAPGAYRASRDLLIGLPPRIAGGDGGALAAPGEHGVAAARRLVMALDRGMLAIQGPPGSGKTYTGARMICDLVRAGKKVGVCAQSHNVITNLMREVVSAAKPENVAARCMQKTKDDATPVPGIEQADDNEAALQAIKTGRARVLGGTAWMWARHEFFEAVDVLFVDEAGQMALANVLAIAQGARAVVLLGDPQQLEQPVQGFHPPGTAASALEHVLGGAQTIPPERGLFLEETWRLAPAICDFTSELFYERRLKPRAGLERQAITGETPFAGAGLWFVPVPHDANQSASREEVAAVAALVQELTAGGVRWRDRDGAERVLELADLLVIAPYNAQVADLAAKLPPGTRVGTVDRLQGQEAPIVIYSMTSSTAEDAPRGMEFLYSPNRFNVATSRARCACIAVGSPRLFEPDCQSPRQIKLANAFCRYLELAGEVGIAPPVAAT